MKHAGNGRNAAEGVTLSGVRKDEDCMQTELWRRPLYAEAEGASVKRKLSGKRTKIFLLFVFSFFYEKVFLFF